MSSQNVNQANELYEAVKALSKDLRSTDAAKAKLILEYAADAIAAFGSTNQEKKLELREITRVTQEIVPPNSFQDLSIIVQSKLLHLMYPRNPKLRNVLFLCVALFIVSSGLFAMLRVVPALSSRWATTSGGIETLPEEALSDLREQRQLIRFWRNDIPGLRYEIYNGSSWNLKEITVHVTILDCYDEVLFDGLVPLPLILPEDLEVGDRTSGMYGSGEPFKTSVFERLQTYNQHNCKVRNVRIVSAKGSRIIVPSTSRS